MNEENKSYMISNLKEAQEELSKIIRELEDDPECNEGSLMVGFAHLYHHINWAWNIRNVDNEKEDRIGACRKEDWNEWTKFPSGLMDGYIREDW